MIGIPEKICRGKSWDPRNLGKLKIIYQEYWAKNLTVEAVIASNTVLTKYLCI